MPGDQGRIEITLAGRQIQVEWPRYRQTRGLHDPAFRERISGGAILLNKFPAVCRTQVFGTPEQVMGRIEQSFLEGLRRFVIAAYRLVGGRSRRPGAPKDRTFLECLRPPALAARGLQVPRGKSWTRKSTIAALG